jgi:16S rRNA (guanine(527)-N(7))-methyltransferase RsmG
VAFREKLAKRARKAGLTPSQDVILGLEAYFSLLGKWNEKVSLTSLRVGDADDEAIDRLLIEPLLAAKYLPGGSPLVIDIGSGGGSPAIPLKVSSSDMALVMVESKTRKAAFLREVVRQLGLTRTSVAAGRFEALVGRPELARSADVVTLRAVRVEQATLARLHGFLKPRGAIFLFGTGAIEAKTLPSDQLEWEGTHALLPQWNSAVIIFRKPG